MNPTLKKPLHPAYLMMIFWMFLYALYWLAPLIYKPPISLEGRPIYLVTYCCVFNGELSDCRTSK